MWCGGHARGPPPPVRPCPRVRVPKAAPVHGPFSAQQDIPRCYLGVLSVGSKHSCSRACSPQPGTGGIPPQGKGLGRAGADGEEGVRREGERLLPALPPTRAPRTPLPLCAGQHGLVALSGGKGSVQASLMMFFQLFAFL